MRLILAFAVVLLAASLGGQVEHVPMVAQCQADQRLWSSQFDKDASSLKCEALDKMANEMSDCATVDPPHKKDYFYTSVQALGNITLRTISFIQRHQFWDEFKAEDAAGKR